MRHHEMKSGPNADDDDGGIRWVLAAQQIRQWAAWPPGKQAGLPPWWDVPALIVVIAALTCANVRLFRRRRRDWRQR